MDSEKKGFTLIELLAVIVILAVIALIATGSIIQIIDRAEKGALEDSAYGIIEAGNVFYIDHILPATNKENSDRYSFEIIENKFVNVKNKEEKLAFKGSMPKTGKLQINANGDTAIAICNRKYCACKSISETKVIVQKQGCEIDEETGEIGTKKDTTPVGTVISYMGNNAPDGYLFCDGSTYKISEYPKLAEQIKTEFGSYNFFGGDGTTNFAVPNLKGEFLRGTGSNDHKNSGNGSDVGIHQNGTEHWNIGTWTSSSTVFLFTEASTISRLSPKNVDSATKISAGYRQIAFSSEISPVTNRLQSFTSRPTNTSVLYCIKY